MIAAGAVCLVMSWDLFRTKVRDAEEVSKLLSTKDVKISVAEVGPSLETYVTGLVGFVLVAAGLNCLWMWKKESKPTSLPDSQLLG